MKIHPLNIGEPDKFDFEVPGCNQRAMVCGSGFGRHGESHARSVILPSVKEQDEAFGKLEQYVKPRKTGQ